MALIKLSADDDSWDRLKAGWREQCLAIDEDFALYAPGSFHVLDQLVAKPERRAGVYGVPKDSGPPDVVCQINTTPLPGHPDPVMRIRMVTVCPAIDFGTVPEGQYTDTLVDLFLGIIELSQDDEMGAKEFKLHLRSPEDVSFFRVVSRGLMKIKGLAHVSVHGSWLHVVKS